MSFDQDAERDGLVSSRPMIVTPDEFRQAFEDFLTEIDTASAPFDWPLSEVKKRFEQWLIRGEAQRFSWNDLYEHELCMAMSQRYQPYMTSARRWFR